MDFYKEHNEMWKLWENLGVNPILRNTQNKVNTELFWFFFFFLFLSGIGSEKY